MIDRPWGSHYPNGTLVLTAVEGAPRLMVATRHGGDYFHYFVPVDVQECKTDRDKDHLVGRPGTQFTGYNIGPSVGWLSIDQMMSLGAGIDVPKLNITIDVAKLLSLAADAHIHQLETVRG